MAAKSRGDFVTLSNTNRLTERIQEWIQDFVNAEAGPSNPSASKAAIGQLSAERISALKKRHVKVPSDPALAAIPCPICKEKFKSEWSEEHEEWVWWNAVAINDKVSQLIHSALSELTVPAV